MKKLILSVLALLGMVSGFALTSCGGGGSGDGGRVIGTQIKAAGSEFAYTISFNERLGGTGSTNYYATITDDRGTICSDVLVTMSNVQYNGGVLTSCTGAIASTEYGQPNKVAMVSVIWGMDLNSIRLGKFIIGTTPSFTINATSAYEGTIHWTGEADYTTVNNNGVESDSETLSLDRTDRILYIGVEQ